MGFLTSEEASERTTLSQRTYSLPVTNLAALHNVSLDSGAKNFSLNTKVLIGTLARLDGITATKDAFHISQATADAFSQGKTSLQSLEPNAELKAKVDAATDSSRAMISTLANSKVFKALERITDDKLDTVSDVNKLADVASKLSKVTANLFADRDTGTKVQFNIFRPRTKDEAEYEILSVEE